MNAVIQHIAGGGAFFSGLVIVGAAGWLGADDRRWRRSAATIAGSLGAALAVASTTPLPWWYYLPAGLVFLIWLVGVQRTGLARPTRIRTATLLAAACSIGIVWELPRQFIPALPPGAPRQLTIFADSVTAGVGAGESSETWPALLARTRDLEVLDYSQPGATTGSAANLADDVTIPSGVVLLEIGGNDLLGGTTDEAFARELERLLQRVCGSGRLVVMFELPLPPTRYAYGVIQRRLAAQYRVALIPKRVLMSVFATSGATLDSIHLSQAGHAQMADLVWSVIGPAFTRVERDRPAEKSIAD